MPFLIVALAYLLGSFPTAYLAGRFCKGVDIRHIGDRNMGAANVYHEIGPAEGFVVAAIDVCKGMPAIILARHLSASETTVLVAGIAAVAGHNWPVFLGFRGGRGLSTTIGVMLLVNTVPMLIAGVPAIISFILFRSTTISAVFLFVPLPLVSLWLGVPTHLILYGMGLPALVGITHFLRVVPLRRHGI